MIFTKMHGNGNDFVVIEDLEHKYTDDGELARQLCDRHVGIGADGILIVRRSTAADIQMVIINTDGSYASMCGNGIRCFAKYVWERDIVKKSIISIETGDGIKEAYMNICNEKVCSVKINMGKASYEPNKIPVSIDEEIIEKVVNINDKIYKINTLLMGVPHTVILGELDKYDVVEGKHIEKYDLFPQGTNVNFCEVVSRKKIRVKTWERGAGPTQACGTGSCASVIACNRLGLVDNAVEVEVPGGILFIELTENGVMMTGPAVIVFDGEYKL